MLIPRGLRRSRLLGRLITLTDLRQFFGAFQAEREPLSPATIYKGLTMSHVKARTYD